MTTTNLVLGMLASGLRHGYELKREHDTLFPLARPLAFGQIYATLARLERDGLVEPGGPEPGKGPERRTYELTEEGRSRLRAWLEDPERPIPYVANTLFAKAVIALLIGDSASGYLRAQREAHMARMRELTAVKTNESALLSDVLSADYALAHLEADLNWIDRAVQRLDALKKEVRA